MLGLALCHGRELNNTGLCTFLAYMQGRAILGLGDRFFKGVNMKLKIVALAISVEKIIFTIFFDASQLSY